MQACEVCGWDTRSGARVCSACRLEHDDADAARATAASADPTGSSLLQDLLAATDERSGGGGTTSTAVRQLRTPDDDPDAGVTAAGVRVNGTATAATSDHGSHANGSGSGAATAPTAGDAPPDAAADAASGIAAVAPADESGGAASAERTEAATADQIDRVGTADESGEATTADQTDVGTTARDAAEEPEHDTAAATSSGDPVHERDASGVLATPGGERSTSGEAPRPGRERLHAALARAGGWTGVAQFALLVLGMLCVFQVVVLVVVNQFLSRAAAGEAAAADALAAHDKVTGVMFPALAVVAIAVCVFAGTRSDDDSGRGGVHRRVAGLPPALWTMIATATAVLTMGLLDAATTVAQARDVTLRAIVVCSVLGLAAFVAPRGFAAAEPPADDARRPSRSPDGNVSSVEPSGQAALASTDGGHDGSAAADDSR